MQANRTHNHVLAIGLAAALGCGAASAALGAGPKTTDRYRVIDVTHGGTLAGVVTLASVPDLPRQVPVSADPDICGTQRADPSAAIGPEGQLQGAMVRLEGVGEGKAFSAAPAELDNRRCTYVPYVQGAPAGGELEVVNSDTALHNVHVSFGPRTLWNIALPLQGFAVTKTLPARAGIVHVRCDVHEWMRATIHLVDNPYFATTGADGSFRIDQVPPGTYTLVVWHERFGELRQEVTVTADATVTNNIILDTDTEP